MASLPNLADDLKSSPYRLVRALAKGGMGEVVVVEHRDLGEQRVMKVLRADVKSDADLAGRLRAEARLLTRLIHPNLVRVVDFGRLPSGRVFLVSELLEGEALSALIKRDGPLALDLSLRLARDVLRGLIVVHKAGIVHRDIKPDNLFVTRDGTLKILDFGVAKVLTPEAKEAAGSYAPTATAMVVGTPSYISPEQIRAEGIDARADLYGLGCVLYAMLAGVPPFVRDTQMDLLKAHILDAPPPIPVSSAVQVVLQRALAKRPEDRFESAEAMLAALDGIEAAAPPPVTPTPRPVVRTIKMAAPIVAESKPREETGQGTRWEHVPKGALTTAAEPEDPTLPLAPQSPSNAQVQPRTRTRAWIWILALSLLILGGLIAILVALQVGWLDDTGAR